MWRPLNWIFPILSRAIGLCRSGPILHRTNKGSLGLGCFLWAPCYWSVTEVKTEWTPVVWWLPRLRLNQCYRYTFLVDCSCHRNLQSFDLDCWPMRKRQRSKISWKRLVLCIRELWLLDFLPEKHTPTTPLVMVQREAPTNRFLPTGLCRNKRGREDWQEQLWVNWRPFIKLISRPVMRWFEGFSFIPIVQLWSGTTSNHLGPLNLDLAWSPVERCTGKRNRALNTPHPVDERRAIERYGIGSPLLNYPRTAGPYLCT
jgi:hypothetical protein